MTDSQKTGREFVEQRVKTGPERLASFIQWIGRYTIGEQGDTDD